MLAVASTVPESVFAPLIVCAVSSVAGAWVVVGGSARAVLSKTVLSKSSEEVVWFHNYASCRIRHIGEAHCQAEKSLCQAVPSKRNRPYQ